MKSLMRVDLLLFDRRCYTYEAYAAKKVVQFFEKEHIPHQLVYLSDRSLNEYLIYTQELPPQWTLSFSNLTPHHRPLCDLLCIPHFLWLVDSFAEATHYLNSLYGRVGIGDPYLCRSLPNLLYLPSGVDRYMTQEKKSFDLVCFADLLEISFLEKTWTELFSASEIASIKQAIGQGEPLMDLPHFFYVEQYLKAKKTLQWVRAFHDVQLDVFGEHAGNKWLVQLPCTIRLHSQLPFIEHFEVLKCSKMALLEPTSLWYWPAVAAGCLPVVADPEIVKYYLAHSEEREKSVETLKANLVEKGWEFQIKRLIECMNENQCHYPHF